MSRMPNQKLKLLYLMKILCEQTDLCHGLTLAGISGELAKYGISAERKSLYHDIEMLRTYGLDIRVHRDRQVRYYVEGYPFSLAERKLLVDAVQSLQIMTESQSAGFVRKIAAMGSRYESNFLQSGEETGKHLKAGNDDVFANIDRICKAILQNSKISFRCFEWNEHKQRILCESGKIYSVSPLKLIREDHFYTVIVYDAEKQEQRYFRVDKMLDVTVLEEKRECAGVDIEKNIPEEAENYNIRLRCDNALAGAVMDRFGTDMVVLSNGERSFDCAVKGRADDAFLLWVLSFGAGVKLLAPDSAVKRLCEIVKQAFWVYQISENI